MSEDQENTKINNRPVKPLNNKSIEKMKSSGKKLYNRGFKNNS